MNELNRIVSYLQDNQSPKISYITEITPHIFIGDINAAKSQCVDFDIKNILCIGKKFTLPDMNIKCINGSNLIEKHVQLYKYISQCVESDQAILIVCETGISESAAVCILYFLFRYYLYRQHCSKYYKLLEIIKFVKSSKPDIEPSLNLIKQLLWIETSIKKQLLTPKSPRHDNIINDPDELF